MATREWMAHVREEMRVNVTDWGDATRVDVNQLGTRFQVAVLPEGERQGWVQAQNAALYETLAETAARYGGGAGSFGEWSVDVGLCFEDVGFPVDKGLPERSGDISEPSLFWTAPESGWGVRMHAAAYVPQGTQSSFQQMIWQPESLPYHVERACGLAPAMITAFGGARQVFVAGLGSWDEKYRLVYAENSRGQARYVFRMLADLCAEMGGDCTDIVRMRVHVPSPEAVPILQEEVRQVWQGDVRPVVQAIVREQEFTDVQVLAIVSDGAHPVTHRMEELAAPDGAGPTVHLADARDWEVIEAGGLRGEPGAPADRQVEQVLGQIETLQRQTETEPEDVCVVRTWTNSPELEHLFVERVGEVANPNALHLIPCIDGVRSQRPRLEVGLTVRRLHLWRATLA